MTFLLVLIKMIGSKSLNIALPIWKADHRGSPAYFRLRLPGQSLRANVDHTTVTIHLISTTNGKLIQTLDKPIMIYSCYSVYSIYSMV